MKKKNRLGLLQEEKKDKKKERKISRREEKKKKKKLLSIYYCHCHCHCYCSSFSNHININSSTKNVISNSIPIPSNCLPRSLSGMSFPHSPTPFYLFHFFSLTSSLTAPLPPPPIQPLLRLQLQRIRQTPHTRRLPRELPRL